MDSVVHFEISANDLARAQKFYQTAFGWQTMSWNPDYALATTTETNAQQQPTKPGAINGGLLKAGTGNVRGISVTIGVPNLEKALDKVQSAGGSVVEKRRAVGDMGFVAYFKDPEGNVVGLWENKQ